MYAALLTPDDLTLRERFETLTLPNDGFRHREHVRLTWIYLTLDPPEIVAARLCQSLFELATSHGVAQRFHTTLTIAWVRMIEFERRSHPDMQFDALVAACPSLLDKDAPLAYYSRELLFSDHARHAFVEPDLRALPRVCDLI